MLERARSGLDRVEPEHLADEVANGAIVVDTRPADQRERDGELPGAVIVDRNVLEWRLDPSSPHRLQIATGHDLRVIVVCNEGFSSSLAARSLQELGLERATDLVGGFQGWRAMTRAPHWDDVYRTRNLESVSWFQDTPATSLRLVESMPGSVIDVGAGTSTLVDHLLEAGRTDITVLDVSEAALALTRSRLGDAAGRVTFEVADVMDWNPDRRYDVWHDRATFHFLTDPAHRRRYVDVVSDAVAANGVLVMGTFADDGPTHCSGLPTARYSAADLGSLFSAQFTLEHQEMETHPTPAGTTQAFTWVTLRHD
jgi:rhodanese-related sulfurtransferase/2-polyprenyl-3-methyl-5-hydroxy-6-metoxy-1,4-benzoquinol methylase